MSTSSVILFLDSATLGGRGSLEKMVSGFEDLNFIIEKVRVEETEFSKDEYYRHQQEIFNLGYSEQALSFNAVNLEWGIEIFQQIAWGEQKMGASNRAYIRTTTDNIALWRLGYDNAAYSTFFLDIGRHLYQLVQPTFGWIDQYHGWTTTHEDIESLQLRHLYWANFFGPRFIENFGRANLLNAPAWRTEELPDGGILYLVAPHLGVDADHVSLSKVKEYFKVANVR
jgi:hypothetical protein